MGLLFDGDDLPVLGKARQQHSERGADCRQSAMQQDQRLSGAVNLVVHVEAVYGSVIAMCSHVFPSFIELVVHSLNM